MTTRKNPAATADHMLLDPDALPASDAHPSADAAALAAAPQPPQPTDTAPTDAPAEAPAAAQPGPADARAAKEEAVLDEVRAAAQVEADRMVADLRARETDVGWAGFRARVDPHVATLKSLAAQIDAVVAQINSAVQEHDAAGQDAQAIARKLGAGWTSTSPPCRTRSCSRPTRHGLTSAAQA